MKSTRHPGYSSLKPASKAAPEPAAKAAPAYEPAPPVVAKVEVKPEQPPVQEPKKAKATVDVDYVLERLTEDSWRGLRNELERKAG